MFLFGLVMTGSMYLYWTLYTKPFHEVQARLASEFPGSSPRVIGGQHKSHQANAPRVLRVNLHVEFDPIVEDRLSRIRANRLAEVLAEESKPGDYDEFETVLIYRQPEERSVIWWLTAAPAAFPIPEEGPLPEGVTHKSVDGPDSADN